MEFLIRLAQAHESFRLAEIQAIAVSEGIDLDVVEYSPDVCSYTYSSVLRSWLTTEDLVSYLHRQTVIRG